VPLFDPRRIIYHDYGGSPDNQPGMFNPYHALVFPSGDVRYRNPEAPYGQAAPHAFLLNNSSLGLSYAGPVGGQPTPAGMRSLQGEYEKMQRAFPGLPGVGHGEAGPMATASSRDRVEGSWRNRVTDLSQTPETGLPQLSLLGGPPPDEAAPSVASAAAMPPASASPMGAPRMPMSDASPSPAADQPGYFDKLMVNPAFMAGLSILGTAPGGNWGPAGANAASQTLKAAMANTEFQRQQQQKALKDKIWNEAFPGGQPNPNHPLTKGIPPDLLASVYALGPDTGVPELSQLAMKGAMGKQQLALQQQSGEQMAKAIFGDAGMPGQGQGQQPQLQPGQPLPQPQAAPQAPPVPQAPLPPTQQTSLPGTVLGGASPMPTPMGMSGGGAPQQPMPQPAPQPGMPSPYSFQGGQRSGSSGEAVLADPQLRKIMYGHIMAGKPDEAMKAYQSALEKAQAPRLAGETKYSQDIAENQAQDVRAAQSSREAWGVLDELERNAKSLGNARLSAAASPTLDTWFGQNVQRQFQGQAYADRQQLLPYLDQLTVLARQQLKGQGSLSDQENAMLQRTLSAARNATDADTFFQNINIARSVLAKKIPERAGYVPPHVLQREQGQAAALAKQQAPAPAEPGRPMQPPQQGAVRTDRLDSAELEGKTVYDHKTGRWGTVTKGEFVPAKANRGKINAAIRQMYAE
jgi:hypothetical protein